MSLLISLYFTPLHYFHGSFLTSTGASEKWYAMWNPLFGYSFFVSPPKTASFPCCAFRLYRYQTYSHSSIMRPLFSHQGTHYYHFPCGHARGRAATRQTAAHGHEMFAISSRSPKSTLSFFSENRHQISLMEDEQEWNWNISLIKELAASSASLIGSQNFSEPLLSERSRTLIQKMFVHPPDRHSEIALNVKKRLMEVKKYFKWANVVKRNSAQKVENEKTELQTLKVETERFCDFLSEQSSVRSVPKNCRLKKHVFQSSTSNIF